MKKLLLLIALFNFGAAFAAAQKPNAPIKSVKPLIVQTPAITEISDAEWKVLTGALQSEDWTKSAAVAGQYLGKLTAENDKKQLAQLRYLRMFALAGKILAIPTATAVPVDENALWKELDDAASEFNGKEFVLPPRRYLNECQKRVNYICRVADNARALRVTATNKTGTAIHSFDYVAFDERTLPAVLPENELFLGGVFKRIEYNQDSTKPWVMRLIYEKGFVGAVVK